MNLSDQIKQYIKQQGRSKIWVSEQIGVNYKTFVDRLKNDRLTAYDLINIGKVINIDLNELKTLIGE